MNNKKSYKTLGIFALIITIVMISCYVGAGLIIKDANGDISSIFSEFHGFSFNVNDEYLNPEFTYNDSSSSSLSTSINQPLQNVTSVNINTFSPDVEVKPGSSNELTIKLLTSSNDIKLEKVVSNNELTVYVKAKKSIAHFNLPACKVEVTLPADYKKQLKIEGKSSDISVDGITFNYLNLRSISGNVRSNNNTSDKSELSTVSGEIECSEDNSKAASISSVSGDINVSGKYSTLTSKSVSGEININFSKDLNKADIASTSGDITLDTNDNISANLDISTTSGDIENNMNVKNSTSSERKLTASSSDDSNRTIKAHTVSGGIRIN